MQIPPVHRAGPALTCFKTQLSCPTGCSPDLYHLRGGGAGERGCRWAALPLSEFSAFLVNEPLGDQVAGLAWLGSAGAAAPWAQRGREGTQRENCFLQAG